MYKAVKGLEMFYLNPDKFEEAVANGYSVYSSESMESAENDVLIMGAKETKIDVNKLIEGMSESNEIK